MTSYLAEVVAEKKYTGNIVIKIGAVFFAKKNPDSGLVIPSPRDQTVVSLSLNPATIDIRRVSTTISSFGFKILDKDGVFTALVLGDASGLVGAEVRIYLGRLNVGMDFANYYELPVTYLQKLDHSDNGYTITTTEQTERMTKPIYALQSALAGDIVAATTIISMRDDISRFPTAGLIKIGDEYASYGGLDLVNNRFTDVIRGELNSVPEDHEANVDVLLAQRIIDNPINIILKILISGGGGGPYDGLQSGLAIAEGLIDIAEIEALRDELFSGVQYSLTLVGITSALKTIENELLMPNGLRFSYSLNSKLTLVVLDRARFVEQENVIDENTITKFPKWIVDGAKVTNVIEVQWDYNEGTNVYQKRTEFRDEDSIAIYDAQTPLKFAFKGIKASYDGESLVNDFGQRLLDRLGTPTPEITINTQIDKSLQTVGDKAYLISNKIPAGDGTLDFSSDVEIISRSINQSSGDVQFKLAFTSFTNIRSGYIAPSDLITSTVTQKIINVTQGRAALYRTGWVMRLWDDVDLVYCDDPPNTIVGFDDDGKNLVTQAGENLITQDNENLILEQASTEDSIYFQDAWTTEIIPGRHRIRFADYDDAEETQKRYAFTSDGGPFADGKPTYRITY